MVSNNKWSDEQLKCYHNLYQALLRREKIVKFPKTIGKNEFFDIIIAIKYHFPEFFYVDLRLISYVELDGYYQYKPRYIYTFDEIVQKQRRIKEIVQNILSEMKDIRHGSVYQKCGWIHNYIIDHCVYDYRVANQNEENQNEEERTAYTIEGFFLNAKAVCQGISLAFKYLCSFVGVEAIIVSGISLRPGYVKYERHSWNIVKSQEVAAHIDITWDLCLSEGSKNKRYDYFFLSDFDMIKDHQYIGYPVCRQLKRSYFEVFKLQFSDVERLKKYITKNILTASNESRNSDYEWSLYFKVKDIGSSNEEIHLEVLNTIYECRNKLFSYSYSINEIQSVFYYRIEFKK